MYNLCSTYTYDIEDVFGDQYVLVTNTTPAFNYVIFLNNYCVDMFVY